MRNSINPEILDEILQAIQTHGNLGFEQGYAAALQNIDKNNKPVLGNMPEAKARLSHFIKVWNNLNPGKTVNL